jgi:hypothetical protein
MQADVGLWIDHRQAVIVFITAAGEETKHVVSHLEKHVRFSGAAAEGGAGEDVRDRKFDNHLNSYYDEIVALLREASSIQIFGPGEAKGELEKRLEESGFISKVTNVETTDKMTDRQIAAKVRERLTFQHNLHLDKDHSSQKRSVVQEVRFSTDKSIDSANEKLSQKMLEKPNIHK